MIMGNLKTAGSTELHSETDYSTVCWLCYSTQWLHWPWFEPGLHKEAHTVQYST